MMKKYYADMADVREEGGLCDDEFFLSSEAQARIEALEWLVEVQDLKMHRIRNAGAWAPKPTPGNCDRAQKKRELQAAWRKRSDSNRELDDMLLCALAATEATR